MPHRYLSIHAHFYQPPREDPFTGNIPNETGAAPFHNWNERIHANATGLMLIYEILNRSALTLAQPCLPGWLKMPL